MDSTVRRWDVAAVTELDATRDCRQGDLPGDSYQWSVLLRAIYARGAAGTDLLGALHFLRCLGARLVPAEAGFRLLPGECPPNDYQRIRREVLIPRAAVLAEELAALPSDWYQPDDAVI